MYVLMQLVFVDNVAMARFIVQCYCYLRTTTILRVSSQQIWDGACEFLLWFLLTYLNFLRWPSEIVFMIPIFVVIPERARMRVRGLCGGLIIMSFDVCVCDQFCMNE